MNFLDILLQRRIKGKKLVIIDAEVNGLSHFKKKYEAMGYAVETILVTSQDLTAFTGPGGKITNDTLDKIDAEVRHSNLRRPHLGEANYWARTGEDLKACLDAIQPELVLTDSKFPEPIGTGKHIADIVTHYFPKVPIVLHTARLSGRGFNVEKAIANQTSGYIEAPKQGESVDAIFQQLLRKQADRAAHMAEQREHPRTRGKLHSRSGDPNQDCHIQPRR